MLFDQSIDEVLSEREESQLVIQPPTQAPVKTDKQKIEEFHAMIEKSRDS